MISHRRCRVTLASLLHNLVAVPQAASPEDDDPVSGGDAFRNLNVIALFQPSLDLAQTCCAFIFNKDVLPFGVVLDSAFGDEDDVSVFFLYY